jgi:hypothetical protein
VDEQAPLLEMAAQVLAVVEIMVITRVIVPTKELLEMAEF